MEREREGHWAKKKKREREIWLLPDQWCHLKDCLENPSTELSPIFLTYAPKLLHTWPQDYKPCINPLKSYNLTRLNCHKRHYIKDGTFETQTSLKVQLHRHVLLEDIPQFFRCMNDKTNLLRLNLSLGEQDTKGGQACHSTNTGVISFFPAAKNAIIYKSA